MPISMDLLPLAARAVRRALNVTGLESRWIKTRIAEHHVYDAKGKGSLPTVVVLHGISSNAMAFARVMQRLRPHVRRVVAPEAPGHGFSRDPSVPLSPETLFESMRDVLDQVLDEPAIVFGNSLGGGVAIHYAIERPSQVRGLFLASPAGAVMDAEGLERFMRIFHMQSRDEALAFLGRLYHRTPWFAPLFAAEVQRMFSRDPIRQFTSSVRPDHMFSEDRLSALSMPVHFLWGRSERLMPEEHLSYFKRSLPAHAMIVEPEGYGHCPHLDDPVRLSRDIIDFARRAVGDTHRGPAAV